MLSTEQRIPTAVEVFLERRKSRAKVGVLTKTKLGAKTKFEFSYDRSYIFKRGAIPIGPELPLTKFKHQSEALFPTFADRIPSRENPAFEEYCRSKRISPEETNPIVLLATIAQRGPSSFVFEPIYDDDFGQTEVIRFRKDLGLTVREFAALFDIAPSTLHLIEAGKVRGKETLKRLQIYFQFPKVALWELERHGKKIHDTKRERVEKFLRARNERNTETKGRFRSTKK